MEAAINWKVLGVREPAPDMHRTVYMCSECQHTDAPLYFEREPEFSALNCHNCKGKATMHPVPPSQVNELVAKYRPAPEQASQQTA